MLAPWDALVPVIGGVLAALVGGTVGGWLGHRSQREHWTRDSRLKAYAELMRCHAERYHTLSDRARDRQQPVDWSDWNRALAVVNMIAPEPVAAEAVQIDEATWRLALLGNPRDMDAWRRLREPVEQAVLNFVNIARRDLDSATRPLSRLRGRPGPDDPIWSADRQILDDR